MTSSGSLKSSIRENERSVSSAVSTRKKGATRILFADVDAVKSDSNKSSDTRSSSSKTNDFGDLEVVTKYAELMSEIERLRTENKLFQQYIDNTADPNIISQIEEQKEEVKRDMRRTMVFAPIKRAVSEKLNLKKAAGDCPRNLNLMETILQAKRMKEEIRLYESSHLDTWQKIDICLAALSDTRVEMRKNEQHYSKLFVDAISQLDLLRMSERDLVESEDEFARVCAKAWNPTIETYDADKLTGYWESQIGKNSSCLARQVLLGNKLSNELRLKLMKEKLRTKRICTIAEQGKNGGDVGKNQESDGSGKLSDKKFIMGARSVDKLQQWMFDKEMMELEKQKLMLASLQKRCSRVGLQLADVTNSYQNTKTELQEEHLETKELTQEIMEATSILESLNMQIEEQERILLELEQKNLRWIEKCMASKNTRSIHSQIMMNAEVYELKKQIRIWERKVQIKEHEEVNLIASLKAES